MAAACRVALESLAGVLAEFAVYGRTTAPGSLPGTAAALWVSTFIWAPSIAAFVGMVLVFPDGHLPRPTRFWRGIIAAVVASSLSLTIAAAIGPYPGDAARPRGFAGLDHPLSGVGTLLSDPLSAAGGLLLVLGGGGAILSLVIRFRRSHGVERNQIAWVVYTMWIPIALLGANLAPVRLPNLVGPVAISVFSIAIAVAVLRRQLFDIRVVISRTAIVVVLVLVLGGLYLGVVEGVSSLVADRLGAVPSLLATAAVAIALAPVHRVVSRRVNRFLFGDRGNPTAVMAQVGQSLQVSEVLTDVLGALADTLVGALKLKDARIDLQTAEGSAAPPERGVLVIPLTVQGSQVGRVVAIARDGERLGAADRRLMEHLAPHFAIVVRAVQLSDDLQISRQRLVSAREDERRRIRRDLHDGLGPTLASISMQVEAARIIAEAEPVRASRELARTHLQVQAAITDVRRLVQGLRPPALDEFGLVVAIRRQMSALSDHSNGSGPAMSMEALGELRDLPAAVEVAAYRIAAEAVTNVVRHAHAQSCVVHLARGKDLRMRIQDDGRGMAPHAPTGVGLLSMGQHVAELGGTLLVESDQPGGTTVTAVLPLGAPAG